MKKGLGRPDKQYPRAKTVLSTTLMPYSGKPIMYKANTYDISEGGIRITTRTTTLPGTNTLVSFNLPGYENIVLAPAEVIWIRRHSRYYEAGIKFTRLNEFDRAAICSYIERYTKAA